MEGPLASLDPVRAFAIQAETLGTVGQHDARGRADTAAEIVEERVDQAASGAVAVDHSDIDGAFVPRQV